MLTLTTSAAAVSAFMNNTPVVVILTPVTIALAHTLGLSASKFLIPLSYATVLGGTCSLIGTSTNIVANGARDPAGPGAVQPVRDLAGRHPADRDRHHLSLHRRPAHPADARDLLRHHGRIAPASVPDRGPGPAGLAAGRQDGRRVRGRQEAQCTGDRRHPRPDLARQRDGQGGAAGGRPDRAAHQCRRRARACATRATCVFGATGQHAIEPIATQNSAVMEGIVGPHSRFVGYRLADLNLRRQYGVYILAVHRHGENLGGNFDQVRLAFGDTILLEGPPEGLKRLFEQGALVSLSEPTEQPLRRNSGWLAISALVAVIVLATLRGAADQRPGADRLGGRDRRRLPRRGRGLQLAALADADADLRQPGAGPGDGDQRCGPTGGRRGHARDRRA